MNSFKKTDLLKFIATAHRNTYGASDKIKGKFKCKPILPKHKDYHFTKGDWTYHDSYAGKVWAPGREVVFFKKVPVWCMSYQGKNNIGSKDFFEKQVFPFLKKALRKTRAQKPFRGLDGFSKDDFKYIFKITGNYKYFTGRESILYKGKEVFFQDVMGELIK